MEEKTTGKDIEGITCWSVKSSRAKDEFHIGKKIKEELCRQQRSIEDFAKNLNRAPQEIKDMLENNQIDVNLLLEMSQLLHRNFFKVLSDFYLHTVENKDHLTSLLKPYDGLHVVSPEEESL